MSRTADSRSHYAHEWRNAVAEALSDRASNRSSDHLPQREAAYTMARGQTGAGEAWCILRMSAARTLTVARSLDQAGMEAWAPSGKDVRRVGPARKRVERDVPLMPTFAFARARHLPQLSRALAMPINPHPPFSIFRWNGRIPLLGDRDMRHLRTLEERELLKAKRQERHVLPIGAAVKVQEGAFTGMSGIVEESDGKFALVAFGGSFRVRVASWLLHADQVENTLIAA